MPLGRGTPNQLHCIQSWEHTGAAVLEGYAQMFAAKAFNATYQTNCTFAYYKDFLNDIGVVLSPPVVMSCRDPHRWMKNHCDSPPSGGGVEMDWMTYLWSIHASAESGADAISSSDYHMLKRIACSGNTSNFCVGTEYLDLLEFYYAAGNYFSGGYGDPKTLNINNKGYAHGVNRYN
ncbi:MAG: hypothetical protein ACOC1F_09445 [Myxococcota bacterium]